MGVPENTTGDLVKQWECLLLGDFFELVRKSLISMANIIPGAFKLRFERAGMFAIRPPFHHIPRHGMLGGVTTVTMQLDPSRFER